MTRFAVIDTNVLVSGLLTGTSGSPTRLVVDTMLTGTIPFVLSESLLAEYREVLLRPAVKARHGSVEADVDAVLEEVVLNASIREPGPADPSLALVDLAPAGDEHLIALLAAVPEAVLVTGDRRLAERVVPWRAVMTPAQFVATLAGAPDASPGTGATPDVSAMIGSLKGAITSEDDYRRHLERRHR